MNQFQKGEKHQNQYIHNKFCRNTRFTPYIKMQSTISYEIIVILEFICRT